MLLLTNKEFVHYLSIYNPIIPIIANLDWNAVHKLIYYNEIVIPTCK